MTFESFPAWIAGAVAIVGILQWAKGLAEKIAPGKVPAWLFSILLPIVAAGVAFSMSGAYVWNLAGTWAIAQLGYEVIVQTVKRKVAG